MKVVSIASGNVTEGGVIQQRMWLVSGEAAESITRMLDKAGFESMSALMDSDTAYTFGEKNLIILDDDEDLDL